MSAWVLSLSPAFEPYAKLFSDNGVDGSMLVHDVDEEWLTTNITNTMHRGMITGELAELRVVAAPLHSQSQSQSKPASKSVHVSVSGGATVNAKNGIIGSGKVINTEGGDYYENGNDSD